MESVLMPDAGNPPHASDSPIKIRAEARAFSCKIVSLEISDVEASLHFYCEVLGCEMRGRAWTGGYALRAGADPLELMVSDSSYGQDFNRRFPMRANLRANLHTGGDVIDLFPVDSPSGPRRRVVRAEKPLGEGIGLELESYDEDAICEYLDSHGIAILDSGSALARAAKTYGAEPSGPSMRIDDPDDNYVLLMAPASSGS